jgi:hypothetical protein
MIKSVFLMIITVPTLMASISAVEKTDAISKKQKPKAENIVGYYDRIIGCNSQLYLGLETPYNINLKYYLKEFLLTKATENSPCYGFYSRIVEVNGKKYLGMQCGSIIYYIKKLKLTKIESN